MIAKGDSLPANGRITLAGHSRSYRRKRIGENDREALLFAMSAGRICLPDDNGFADGGQDGITDDRAKTDKHVCVFNRCRGKYESLLFPPFYSFQLVSFRHPRRRCHPPRERASERDGRERGERTRGGITRSCRANICAITREKCHPPGIPSGNCVVQHPGRDSLVAERTCSRPGRSIGVRGVAFVSAWTTQHGPWCIVSMLQASSRLHIRGSCQ